MRKLASGAAILVVLGAYSHGVITSCKLVGNAYTIKACTLDFSQPELAGHADPGVAGGMARVNYEVSITSRA